MIHPSYQELIATINEGQDLDEAPVVSSRYSLVLATSKRARQIIGGAEPLVKSEKRHETAFHRRRGDVQRRGYNPSGI